MAGINFVIDVQTKGIEVLQTYKTELTQISTTVKALTTNQNKLDRSTDDVANGMKKAERQVDSMRKAVDKTENSFKKFGSSSLAALATIGLTVAGINTYLGNLTTKADELTKAFSKVGGDFGDLQALARMAGDVGISVDTVASKITDATNKITKAAERGSGGVTKMFKEMNISFAEFDKMSVVEKYQKLATYMQTLPKDMQNFYEQETGLKELTELNKVVGDLGSVRADLVNRNLLFTPEELAGLKQVKLDLADTIGDFEIFTNKVVLKALPQFNELLKQVTANNKDAFDNNDVTKYAEYLTQAAGLVGMLVGIFKLLADTVIWLTESIGNFGVSFVELVGSQLTHVGTDIKQWGDDLKRWFNDDEKLAKEYTGSVKLNVEGGMASEYDLKRKEAYDREVARLENKRIDTHKEGLEREKQINENYEDYQDGINTRFMDKLKTNISSWKLATDAVVSPEKTVAAQQEEIARKAAEGVTVPVEIKVDPTFVNVDDIKKTQEKLDALFKLGERSGGIGQEEYRIKTIKNLSSLINSSNAEEIEKINAKLQLKEILKNSDLEELKRLDLLKAMGEKNGGITAATYNVRAIALYKARMEDVNNTEIEKLEAKAKIAEIQKFTADEYYKLIDVNNKKAIAKQITESEAIKANLIILQQIVDLGADETVTLEAQVKTQESKNRLIAIEKERKEKIKALDDDMLNAQIKLTTLNKDPMKAFEMDLDRRMAELREKFKDSDKLQERIDLEVKLIDAEREEVELNKVKDDIEKLKENINKTNFFDFDKSIESMDKLAKLKERQIELEKKHGAAIENTGNLSLFTNEKVKAITEASFDIMAKGLANITTRTESTSKIMRQMLADILTEINKVLIRQIVLNATSSFGGSSGGNSSANFMGYFLQGLGRNHTGGLIEPDAMSGQMGLASNETARVLTHDELVLTKRDQANLRSRLRSNTSGGSSGTAVMDTEGAAQALVRTTTFKKFLDSK